MGPFVAQAPEEAQAAMERQFSARKRAQQAAEALKLNADVLEVAHNGTVLGSYNASLVTLVRVDIDRFSSELHAMKIEPRSAPPQDLPESPAASDEASASDADAERIIELRLDPAHPRLAQRGGSTH